MKATVNHAQPIEPPVLSYTLELTPEEMETIMNTRIMLDFPYTNNPLLGRFAKLRDDIRKATNWQHWPR